MHRNVFVVFILIVILLTGCARNKVQTGDTLPAADIHRLRTLNILDSGEQIIGFYSQHENEVGGNFYTNKRLASYWLDKDHINRQQVNQVAYSDVIAIDTVFSPGDFNCPYLIIRKNDSTSFHLYIDGSKEDIYSFYEGIIRVWKKEVGTSQ